MLTLPRTFAALALVAVTLTALAEEKKPAPAPPTAPGADGFVQLFNGKDLTGWKTHPKAPKESVWSVADGLLTCTGPASHIFSERGDYKNFVYRAVVTINDGGNSGQYVRTKFEPGFPPGYEAQINATHGDKIRTGSLYPDGRTKLKDFRKEITVMDTAPHAPNEFFTQEVTAIGNHIVIKVNGKVTVDFRDPNNTFTQGHFAFQHHDPTCKVGIKSAEVKELPADATD